MLKKLLVSGLVMIVVIAVGTSAYNVYAGRITETSTTSLAEEPNIQALSQDDESGYQEETSKDWNQNSDPIEENITPVDIGAGNPNPENLAPEARGNADQVSAQTNGPANGQGNRYGQGGSRGQGNKGAQAGSGDHEPGRPLWAGASVP